MAVSYPPAAMTRTKAAAYCDLSVAEFEREVAAGRLPQPMPYQIGRQPHWKTSEIDKALAVLAGEVADGEVVVVGERDAA